MDRALALIATLFAGALVAFQPPANAELGREVGSLAAAMISIAISAVIIAVLLVVFGDASRLGDLTHFQPSYALGGIAGAAIVGISLVTVTELGAGGVVAATVCTQLIVSALLDRFGWFGLEVVELGPMRIAGFALLIGGTILVTVR
jgi:bacterial/archaeal transporter family-2 protein